MTRPLQLFATMHKPLLEVADQPFLAHQLRLLQAAGIRRVVLCVGYRGEMIEQEFRHRQPLGVELSYSFDGAELLGTGGAIKKALPWLGKKLFVLYGDSYLPIDYAAPARAFLASGKIGLMTVFRNENRWAPSNVSFAEGAIKSYNKEQQTPEMRYIDYGLGVFDAAAFSGWPVSQAFDLADVYRELVAKNELAGHEVKQRFYEIGSPKGLAELDAMLRSQRVSATT